MEKFKTFTGLVAPLDRNNVDTDAIIPKQFLKSIHRTGFGPNLFDEWRYLDKGEPGKDCATRPLNMSFVLNQPRYKEASILITGENFGCGSSREHAVWAFADAGFKVILAESFADIFYNNCFKNGILPITLSVGQLASFRRLIELTPGYSLTVNLMDQWVGDSMETRTGFEIDPYRKTCLLDGLDEIGQTLTYVEEIKAFESKYKTKNPWLFKSL